MPRTAFVALGLAAILALAAAPGKVLAEVLFDEDGRRLEVDISEQFPSGREQVLMDWIRHISTTLAAVYGHWPERHWRISIQTASGASDDVIPWAQVHRGDIDRVEFFIIPSAGSEALKREWTSYHELAHLLIPYRGWGDAWFSEGLASYYQNLMQARAGLLSEREFWQKLHNGFMRGRNDTRFDGQALQSVSKQLRKNGGFMRVYWSGAWYFLAADIALRQAPRQPLSLDLALKQLNHCCAGDALSVPGMISRLDTLNRVDIFSALYGQALASTAVPDFESLFETLGISIDNGQVKLSEKTPGAQLRRQILQPQTL